MTTQTAQQTVRPQHLEEIVGQSRIVGALQLVCESKDSGDEQTGDTEPGTAPDWGLVHRQSDFEQYSTKTASA